MNAITPTAPKGWRLVPLDPDGPMKEAALAAAKKVNPHRSGDHVGSVALDSLSIYRALLAASPPPPAIHVTIKPLVWERIEGDQFLGGSTAFAQSILGQYQAWGNGRWSSREGYMVATGDLESGIAACEADYTTRVCSALDSVTITDRMMTAAHEAYSRARTICREYPEAPLTLMPDPIREAVLAAFSLGSEHAKTPKAG